MGTARLTLVRTIGWLMTLLAGLPACGKGTEGAAQSARIAMLEQEVRRLGDKVAALEPAAHGQGAAAAPQPASAPDKVFSLNCPQPWMLQPPPANTLWNCRAPAPTPEGLYPQCSVVVQPQVAIETKTYFEFALNTTPQFFEVKNVKDTRVKLNGADAFEATCDADPKPVPLKMMSALLPHNETTYVVTCFAPSATFANYSKAFRQIIDTFAFK